MTHGRFSRAADFLVYAAVAGLFGLLILRGSSGPKPGAFAKAFELPLATRAGTFRLEEHRGKPVLLEIFASWCGACRSAAPMLDEVYRDAAKTDVVFIGVSVDDDARAALSAQETWPISYPVAIDDGSVSRDYGVSLLPTFVLIGRDGSIQRVSAGVPSRRTLSRWLSEL